MPPKIKVTKNMIIDTALSIVRQYGADALNARTVASALGCSTQPVFSNFDSMDTLKNAVLETANSLYHKCRKRDMEQNIYPPYKASGMSYIRFAQEEKELFKLLFMRDRREETIPMEDEEISDLIAIIRSNLGISEYDAKKFHLEMWIYVHGIAVMAATGFLTMNEDFISQLITDAYQSLCKYYTEQL